VIETALKISSCIDWEMTLLIITKSG